MGQSVGSGLTSITGIVESNIGPTQYALKCLTAIRLTNGTLGTVPAGKTWYIVGANITHGASNSGAGMNAQIQINGATVLTAQAPDTAAGQVASTTATMSLPPGCALVATTGQTVGAIVPGGRAGFDVWYYEV